MSFCEFHWYSEVLQKQVATNVILPDTGVGPFPTYYLLHGLSDDHTTWQRKTRIEHYAGGFPFIIVMPDGFRSFYTDTHIGPNYAKYIALELPAIVERQFHAKPDRGARCIGGLSMGGYGALRIALGFPERYLSVNSHSGALMAGSRETPPDRFHDAEQIFGPSPRGTDHDLIVLAGRAKAKNLLPKIRIDTGLSDFLLQDNRDFHQALTDLKIPHEYVELPGDHNWDYWDDQVKIALKFHLGAMDGYSAPEDL